MPRVRPACEIEPVRSIASRRRIFPGPMDRPGPKSTRSVSLVPVTMPAPVWHADDTSNCGRGNIFHPISVMVKPRPICSFMRLCAGMPDLLTTDEAATYLRLSERKLYELVATAAIPCSKVTGRWLFPKAALDRWVSAGLLTTAPLAQAAPPIVGGSHDPLLEWALRESGSGLATLPEGERIRSPPSRSGRCHGGRHPPAPDRRRRRQRQRRRGGQRTGTARRGADRIRL